MVIPASASKEKMAGEWKGTKTFCPFISKQKNKCWKDEQETVPG
ncbi:rCG62003 [Rattus norvegicus]|uniref:RCG62003 n=1 Tax=Rattus norvegicus TaxID=10116 RepID=A6HC50_RAT|nr:rCG62003 [Rattus norvegicus]